MVRLRYLDVLGPQPCCLAVAVKGHDFLELVNYSPSRCRELLQIAASRCKSLQSPQGKVGPVRRTQKPMGTRRRDSASTKRYTGELSISSVT